MLNIYYYKDGIKLPTGYYFGVTAATGDLTDTHDVITVKTYELDTPAGVSKVINKVMIYVSF